MGIFESLELEIKKHIPAMEVRFKDESFLNRIIAKVLFFNNKYSTSYVTTLYPYVYFPSRVSLRSRSWRTLAHEFVHLWDSKKQRVWFPISYLLPQFLSVLALFATIWSPLFLLFLLFLLPIPALFRKNWEVRGYAMTLFLIYLIEGKVTVGSRDFIERQFTGWAYYKMWPFKGKLKAVSSLSDKLEELLRSELVLDRDENFPYRVLFHFVRSRNLLHTSFKEGKRVFEKS